MGKYTSTLNDEQKKVFVSFTAGANLYITGKGGSGKSFLARYIIDYCKQKGKQVLVCASMLAAPPFTALSVLLHQ